MKVTDIIQLLRKQPFLKAVLKHASVKHLATSLVISLIFTLTLTLSIIQAAQQQQTAQENHARRLAQIVSRQLITPITSQNWVSLQSLLNDIAQPPSIVNASLYDDQNNLLVQAEDRDGTTSTPLKTFSYSFNIGPQSGARLDITLLKNTNVSLLWPSLLGLLFLCSISAGFYYANKNYINHRDTNNNYANKRSTPSVSQQPLADRKDRGQIILTIKLLSLDRVYRQLNAGARQQQLRQIDTCINDILAQHSGQAISVATPGILIVTFGGHEQQACFDRAFRSAVQLCQHSRDHQWIVKPSCLLSHTATKHTCANIHTLKNNRHESHEGIYINTDTIDNTLLNDNIVLTGASNADNIETPIKQVTRLTGTANH